MRKIMKLTIYWAIAVMTVSTAFAQAQASTFQNPKIEELYTEDNRPELYCLAQNIYFEAKSEPLAGQYAVADVVLNRVQDTRYPDTICKVVNQGKRYASGAMIRNKCQFSWYCDGKSDEVKDKKSYKKILDFANLIMHNSIKFVDITDGATHYHADYVKPDWAKTKTRTTEIGDHSFYKWEKK